ncbi:hypothetical protein B0H66DRAFT_569729 [Apodospora peruviana]|uniref:Uncharacterized protein n=1 Tax=Apodospora peruviana TaxID=516989 RepID=A0AAE0M014_9PEZI|nr:hypothetical protein B0H66DRAFT_569729 [Apodospora peruviana]
MRMSICVWITIALLDESSKMVLSQAMTVTMTAIRFLTTSAGTKARTKAQDILLSSNTFEDDGIFDHLKDAGWSISEINSKETYLKILGILVEDDGLKTADLFEEYTTITAKSYCPPKDRMPRDNFPVMSFSSRLDFLHKSLETRGVTTSEIATLLNVLRAVKGSTLQDELTCQYKLSHYYELPCDAEMDLSWSGLIAIIRDSDIDKNEDR